MSTAIPSMRVSNRKKTVYDSIPDGDYPARIVRFTGLGVQDQQAWEGEKKSPAFKCSIAFELIGLDATGLVFENDEDKVGKPIEPRPSCQFKDYFLFPGAKRGGVFDLVRCIDPSLQAVPGDLEWFMQRLGEIVSVRVGSYKNKLGVVKNKVVSVSPIPQMFRSQVGDARSEMVAFNPYKDTPEMFAAYSKMYKFQRDDLASAHDAKNIPFAGKEVSRGDEGETNNQTQNQAPRQPQNQVVANNEPPMDFDDDIPF